MLPIGVLILGLVGVVLLTRQKKSVATAGLSSSCFGNLNATTYSAGFSATDFSSTTAASVTGGKVQLNTNLTPLDADHIELPFDQNLRIKYVYEEAGYSATLGWFFFDQVQPFLDSSGKLADNDNDGIADFFQSAKGAVRPRNGIWQITAGQTIPDLLNGAAAINYSDGGTYARMPNLLESFMAAGGNVLWKLCDDDTDTGNSGAPVADSSTLSDGIPDYDVNGDGIVGNEPDRSFDMGIIPGHREIVFFAQTYGGTTLTPAGVGLPMGSDVQSISAPPLGGGGVASGDVLRFTAGSDINTGDKYLRWKFSTTGHTFAAGECIHYAYYIEKGCATDVAGIDFRFNDNSLASAHGFSGDHFASPTCGAWATRDVPIAAGMVGRVVDRWEMAIHNDTIDQPYIIYFDNVGIAATCGGVVTAGNTGYSTGVPTRNLIENASGFLDALSYNVSSFPWFSKTMLNPDFGATPGTVQRRLALGCSKGDSACYGAKTDSGGNPANLGWLDQATMDRLASPTMPYNQLIVAGDPKVVNIVTNADGQTPHFVALAPSTAPNRWVIGYDDQPIYGTTDKDYNDVVFLIERTNGGEVVSNLISADIPAADLATTSISRIRIRFSAEYPSPGCDGDTTAAIRIYYSVDNKVTWRQVTFPSRTTGDVIIDALANGDLGNQLYWRAEFVSSKETCNPQLDSLNIGYEAVQNGEFKYGAPVTLSNVVYSGSFETPPFPASEPAATGGDFSLRGHFRNTQLFDPVDPTVTTKTTLWDAGLPLATRNPDTRAIYTSVGGAATPFDVANGATLYPLLLSTTARTQQYAAKFIYDFSGDLTVDDNDAKFLLQWVRGWEYASGVTITPTHAAQQRAWKLGAVHNSSPAIVGPPPRPSWLDGTAAPPSMVILHNAFRAANNNRSTKAIVGAQDGMVHAFNAGQFRYSDNMAACTTPLSRGCFAGGTDAARYGDGSELWAYIPPSQLGTLRNLHPVARRFTSAIPTAEVDGSIAVEDIYDPSTTTFKTVAFASLGRNQPYVSAVDVSGTTPVPLWADDFSDPDFYGTELSPSVGLSDINHGRFAAIVTSGLSSTARDLFLFVLDAANGTSIMKAQLNTGANAAQANGFAGYPNLVDANQDGLIDRVYSVDTTGRIFKYDLTNNSSCVVASVGETVYSGMAIESTVLAGTPVVKLFLGGAPPPDGTGTELANYHLFMFQDDDPVGTCTNNGATQEYKVTLATGQKLWAAPFIGSDQAFYASAGAQSLSVCAVGDGDIFAVATSGIGDGLTPVGGAPSPTAVLGSPVAGIRVYDGHVLVNSVGGKTTIVGGSAWNNIPSATGGSSSIGNLSVINWAEQ